jgi:hypothetical protein
MVVYSAMVLPAIPSQRPRGSKDRKALILKNLSDMKGVLNSYMQMI